jgi:hypothetical protein
MRFYKKKLLVQYYFPFKVEDYPHPHTTYFKFDFTRYLKNEPAFKELTLLPGVLISP